jgi:hypothetical protein
MRDKVLGHARDVHAYSSAACHDNPPTDPGVLPAPPKDGETMTRSARQAISVLGAAAVASGLGVLLAACGSKSAADRAATDVASHQTPVAAAAVSTAAAVTPPPVAPDAVVPDAVVPDAVALADETGASSSPSSLATPASAAQPAGTAPAAPAAVPRFTTPDAAMQYLVAAYNTNNEVNIRHVTTPDSRDQFEAERQWVKTFHFRSCAANGSPTWDYTCVLNIVATMPDVSATIDPATGAQVMNEVTVLVAPAERTGFYLAANEGCGGG